MVRMFILIKGCDDVDHSSTDVERAARNQMTTTRSLTEEQLASETMRRVRRLPADTDGSTRSRLGAAARILDRYHSVNDESRAEGLPDLEITDLAEPLLLGSMRREPVGAAHR